ncbi:MAG: gephyrin-like molybdotransferase Glp [Candidatus Nanopelagicales bacterium]|nr:molybdopterin-binding protein [Candidatus Nanopelagicales bacterium]MDZ4249589.1 gephyrin-like molybdotransferase Glp [Candidatus Nanopelagicales bacterium]
MAQVNGPDKGFEQMLAGITTLEPLDVTLGDARGCQIAQDVVASAPMPSFSVCAAPGFAVRSQDTGGSVELKVVDEVPAGYAPTAAVTEGTAIKVAAGAQLPAGADAVAPLRQSTAEQGVVVIRGSVAPGCDVIAEGAVAAEGQVLVAEGTTVDARVVGVLASMGSARALVRPRPRVVIVSVGAELRQAGADVKDGLLYDATGWMLATAADEAGALSYRVGPIGDDIRTVADTLDDQLVRADLIVVCGGIASPDDSVRSHLEQFADVSFDDELANVGVFGYGKFDDDDIPVVALPDDPASAFVLFTAVVRSIIGAMLGRPPERLKSVVLSDTLESSGGSLGLRLAKLSGGGKAVPVTFERPTVLDLMEADLLIRVGPGARTIPAGASVTGLRLRPGANRTA